MRNPIFDVRNKKCIANLASKSLKANKARNIAAVIAILLTCTLFTSVCMIAASLLHTVEYNNMRQVGTTHHAGYKFLTEDLYKRVADDAEVVDIGKRIFINNLANEELLTIRTELSYADEAYVSAGFTYPTVGRLPESGNEIALSADILHALGVPEELGQSVNLSFASQGVTYNESFEVVGICEADIALGVSNAYVSLDYVKRVAPPWTGEDVRTYLDRLSEDNSFIAGSVHAGFNFESAYDVEEQLRALSERLGFDTTLISEGVNWANIGYNIDSAMVAFIVLLFALFTFSGYLIIYNIFFISVSGDVRFYGLLKTIGTTGKQIKHIVYKQAFTLYLIAMPLGLALGYLVGILLMPAVVDGTIYMDSYMFSAHPLLFIAAAIFALFTVLLSCMKPARFAAKLSPIEAVRHTEISTKIKTVRKAQKVTPASMARAAMRRNRKKAVLVIVSLSLSVLLFNVTYTFVNSIDMEEYLSGYTVSDFLLTHDSVLSYLPDSTLDGVSAETIAAVKSLDGVTDIGKTYATMDYHLPTERALARATAALQKNAENMDVLRLESSEQVLAKGELPMCIYGVSESLYDIIAVDGEEASATAFLSEEAQSKFHTGDYVLTTGFYGVGGELYYPVGEKVEIDFQNGKVKEYEVLSPGMLPYAVDKRFSTPMEVSFILPEHEYLSQMGDRSPLAMTVNVTDDALEASESFFQNYTETVNPELGYASRETYLATFESLTRSLEIMGFTLATILGLIGLFNFVNTLFTGIDARKTELAMLQSIGMTGKQLRAMLMWEGLTYGGSATIFLLTVGNLLTMYIVEMLSNMLLPAVYQFMWMPVVASTVLLLGCSIVVPWVLYTRVQKKTIVERLRSA